MSWPAPCVLNFPAPSTMSPVEVMLALSRDEAINFFSGLADRQVYEASFRISLRSMKRCKGSLGEGKKLKRS